MNNIHKHYACWNAWWMIHEDNKNPTRIWSIMTKDGIVTHVSTSELIDKEMVYKCKQFLTPYEVL